jgi:hypothetical protein
MLSSLVRVSCKFQSLADLHGSTWHLRLLGGLFTQRVLLLASVIADMLEVGVHPMTPVESRTHFAMWCITSAPLILVGCPS